MKDQPTPAGWNKTGIPMEQNLNTQEEATLVML